MQAVALPYYGEQQTDYDEALSMLQNHQYSSSIIIFKKILRNVPEDINSKIGLINAYLARATYYANTKNDYNKASTDLKSALFYLQYFGQNLSDDATKNAINETKNNLAKIQPNNKTFQEKFALAKSLRTQGEFAAAAYDFIQLSQNSDVKTNSLIEVGDIMNILSLYDKSIEYYKKSLMLKPNNENVYLKLARVYEKTGNIEAATDAYNFIMANSSDNKEILSSLENIWYLKTQQNPKDAEAHANLGAIYQKQNNLDMALKEYQMAEKLNPTNVNTRLNLGTLYQQKKDYETAISAYNSILSLYPNHKKSILFKAQCNAFLGNKEEAKADYQKYLQLQPDDIIAKNEMLSLLKENMTAQEILDILYDDVKNNAKNPDAYYKFAYELHKNNRLDDAITYYEIVISLNPKFEDAYINLAQAYKQKGNIQKSHEIINEAQKQLPNAKAINEYQKNTLVELQNDIYKNATEIFSQGNYSKAIEEYKKIQPVTVDALIGIGSSYQALKDYKNAISYFKKALEKEPSNSELLYYIALGYSNLEDYKNAQTYSKKALLLSKDEEIKALDEYLTEQILSLDLQNAYNLYEQGNYQIAINELNKIISKNPNNAYGYYYRALANDGLKKYKDAISDYTSALKYSNDMDIAYYSIAIDYDYLADYANAVKYYEIYAEKIKEENEYTKYARERAEELKPYVK